MAPAAKGHPDSVVRLCLPVQALVHPCLAQQGHRPLLDHPGADAAENVLAALALEDDAVDAAPVQ